jgi:hypothetical protein
LSKRLKKHNHFFDILIIDKGMCITYITKEKNTDKESIESKEKQIKEYNDSSWGINYNNLLIGQNKHKEKNSGKNSNSNNNKKNNTANSNNSLNKKESKSKSKIKKSNINKLNKNRMHINYINKIQRNMTNIMDFLNEPNDCFTPYNINKLDSTSYKNDNKKLLRSKEISPSPQDKLKYSTINHTNKRNNSQILLNPNGNMEQIKLYRKIKDYNKLFDRKLSQITRNIMPKSIRRTLSAFQNIRNSSPNFYDSYRNICSNNIKKINKNSNLSLKRKNKYRQLNSSNSNINYHNISANSNKKKSINYFRKKTPHRVNSQRKEITPNLKINNNFHNLYSNSNSKGKMLFNDNLRSSLDNSNHKRQFKKINISNVNNISAPNNHFNSYNSTKDSNKVNNLINNDNNLKNNNKINHNNNHIDGMLNNVLIIANIKNKFEVNTVSHGANKHSSFKKFKYNLSGNSVSSNK